MTEPLPCPFCGANEGLTMADGSTHRWGIAYCNGCGASAGEVRRAYPDDGEWYEEAIQQWNQRATPPQREVEIEFTQWLHPQMGVVPVDPKTPLILKAKLKEST